MTKDGPATAAAAFDRDEVVAAAPVDAREVGWGRTGGTTGAAGLAGRARGRPWTGRRVADMVGRWGEGGRSLGSGRRDGERRTL